MEGEPAWEELPRRTPWTVRGWLRRLGVHNARPARLVAMSELRGAPGRRGSRAETLNSSPQRSGRCCAAAGCPSNT